jgi:Fe-S cluster assembly protein SufD
MTTFSTVQSIEQAWDQRRRSQTDEPRQVTERRERSVRKILTDGLPTTRHEEWKYTSLRPLLEKGFVLNGSVKSSAVNPDVDRLVQSKKQADSLVVVFIDGCLDLALSDKSALAAIGYKTLSQAESEYDSDWWDGWQSAPGMTGLFAAMNAGFARNGAVFKIKKNQIVDKPLHILHVATPESSSEVSATRLVFALEDGAKLRVVEEFIAIGSTTSGWSNGLTQFKLGALADCGYYRIVSAPDLFHTGSVSAVLDRGSCFETFSLLAGGRLARVNVDVKYTAPDAECIINGLYLTRHNEHVDHHTSVDHQVGHCRTHQLYKGILNDESRAVFNGKIFIRKDAQKTEAYQTSKNLLLSKAAEVDAKPQLEIDADDVKASHGAAIGSVDPLELFYLQSRCIGRAEAMAMLCRGFADDVVMRLKDDGAKRLLNARVADWFAQEVRRAGASS